MDCFNVTILGCGSAKPTRWHKPSAQVVNSRGNLFLVDCAEGVQSGLLRCRIPAAKIGHIFLSHLHGDHCLGLVGLLATLGLGDRQGEVVIHGEASMERVFGPQLDFFCPRLSMAVTFAPHDTRQPAVIYEDDALRVRTVPLRHRVPTAGFVFEEKPRLRHLNIERAREAGIPVAYYNLIKQGADWTMPNGRTIPNAELTTPPTPPRRYAYVSDTCYPDGDARFAAQVAELVAGADVLYHEATYGQADRAKAVERGHSTTLEAAETARRAGVGRLVIGHFSSQNQGPDEEARLVEEARTVFPATSAANEGDVIDVKGESFFHSLPQI